MLVIGLIMTFGAVLVSEGSLSVGGLTAFMMYNGLLVDPVMDFLNFYRRIIRINVSIKRLNRIFNEEPYGLLDNRENIDLEGNISFNGVSFSYPNTNFSLNDLTFKISKGSKVAIIGESGSGKTTLTKLLVGFQFPDDGEVKYDNIEITPDNIALIRDKLAVSFQDTFLFNDTIKENIRLVKPDASDQEIQQVIKLACLDKLVNDSNFNENNTVGENGNKCSGGEKQRIGIARVFLRNMSIIILDEAISSLDSVTTTKIIKNIKRYYSKATVLMIAHKITSIQDFDKIIVMKDGEIVAKGTHDYLINTSNYYKEIYNKQFIENDNSFVS